MSLLEATGWIAFALNVWGNLALTSYSIRGWVIRLLSNAFWVAYSVDAGAWALLANHVVFAGINIVGWIRWSDLTAGEKEAPASSVHQGGAQGAPVSTHVCGGDGQAGAPTEDTDG